MNTKKRTRIVILAAGKGNRMKSQGPKVLAKVGGIPMIERLLTAVEKAGIDDNPVIVVGFKKEMLIEALGRDKYHYIIQDKQLGTGHAVKLTKDYLKNRAENVLVLFGDHPLVKTKTIQKINEQHLRSDKKIMMATVKLPNFNDWRICFKNFSRITRDKDGKIVKDTQYKDATEEEKKITEVNPGYYSFNATWLWSRLEQLNNNNSQEEYYLTDLLQIATSKGLEIGSIEIEPHEALGANTKEELEILERFAV